MSHRSTDDSTRNVSRRKVLVTGLGTITVGIAGCTGDDSTPAGTDSPEETDTETDTEEPESTPAVSEPVESVPGDAECAVCNMKPAEYPDWNAQLSHENGERVYFCTSGCMSAYYAAPEAFEAPDSAVAGAWATDFETRELVDALQADYVLETDPERVDDPMMRNPLPFADREDAVAYVEQYDDLTEHDVVGLDAFDLALARVYRGKMLPETDEASILDPVSVPEDAECAVCNMMPAKFPDWNAQLSHEDGERAHFCSPGCMTAYYADPGRFDGHERADVVGVWVNDLSTAELTDGTVAHYVLEMDGSRHEDMPMMRNPLPFADREDAVAYVEQYDDLTEGEDVVALTAFDVDLAAEFRPKAFD